jgi:hypothetical protein
MSGTSDFVYNNARVLLGSAQLDWTTAPINFAFVGLGYSPSKSHTSMADIPVDAIIIRDVALTSTAISAAGICYGVIPVVEALLSDIQIVGMVLYSLGGDDASSPLIYYSSTGPGFPFFAQGFDYFVGFDQTSGGWFEA